MLATCRQATPASLPGGHSEAPPAPSSGSALNGRPPEGLLRCQSKPPEDPEDLRNTQSGHLTEAYEDLVENVIVAAEIETTMRRLIEEIEKVKRRLNALQYRVIPELKSTEAFIRQRLEEMERDNFMRLKRFKAA